MQRLLSSKLASSNVSKNLTRATTTTTTSCSSSLFSSHPYKTFASLTKPPKDHVFTSPFTNPFRHFHSSQPYHPLLPKFQSFLPNPLLSKHFFSTKSFAECKVGFFGARFGRGFSLYSPNSGSLGRSWRSRYRRLTDGNVVYGLILANVAVFLLWRIADKKFMMKHFMISLDNFKSGRVHTLITSAFSHIDLEHIVSNMIGLYFFGTNIQRMFGPEYLLKLYLAGAIGGSVFYLVQHAFMALSQKGQGLWVRDPSKTPGLGASGAVNAIMLLDIFLNPRATLYFDFIIPVPAILLGIFLVGKDLLRIIEGDSNISGSAHLGGAAVAALTWYRIRKGRF